MNEGKCTKRGFMNARGLVAALAGLGQARTVGSTSQAPSVTTPAGSRPQLAHDHSWLTTPAGSNRAAACWHATYPDIPLEQLPGGRHSDMALQAGGTVLTWPYRRAVS